MGKFTVVGREKMVEMLPYRRSALFIGPVKIDWTGKIKKATARLQMNADDYATLIEDHFGFIPGHFYIEAINLVAAVLALKLRQRVSHRKPNRIPVIAITGKTRNGGGELATLQDNIVVEAEVVRGPKRTSAGFVGRVYITDDKGVELRELCKMEGESTGMLVDPKKLNSKLHGG